MGLRATKLRAAAGLSKAPKWCPSLHMALDFGGHPPDKPGPDGRYEYTLEELEVAWHEFGAVVIGLRHPGQPLPWGWWKFEDGRGPFGGRRIPDELRPPRPPFHDASTDSQARWYAAEADLLDGQRLWIAEGRTLGAGRTPLAP